MEFSKSIKKSNTDEWFTYRESVEVIEPYLQKHGYKKILCPFDKEESSFVQVFREKGYEVDFSHIQTGTDFFDIQNLNSYDAVVSNPPFSLRQKIFERLFESNVPFAMITNFNGLFDAKSRWALFKDNEFEIIVPSGRMTFFNEDNIGNSPNFQSVYVCKGMAEKQIEFVKMK